MDALIPVAGVAALAGLVNGLAGFGYALVAAGLWLMLLPAETVPPLVVLGAVVSHVAALLRLRARLDFRMAGPMVLGGVLGIAPGLWLLAAISPDGLTRLVGVLLLVHAGFALSGVRPRGLRRFQGPRGDAGAGFFGGILAGLSGLSGPVPIIWLELSGVPPHAQRARYQPYNLAVLALTGVAMVLTGLVTREVLRLLLVVTPATLLGSAIGVRLFARLPEARFRQVILLLLLLLGALLLLNAR